jgi:hypothetical protein
VRVSGASATECARVVGRGGCASRGSIGILGDGGVLETDCRGVAQATRKIGLQRRNRFVEGLEVRMVRVGLLLPPTRVGL